MKRILKRLLCLAFAGTMLLGCACSSAKNPAGGNENLHTENVVYNYDSGIDYNGKCLSFIANGNTMTLKAVC